MREFNSQVWITVLILGLAVFSAVEARAVSVTLKGSPESMLRQNRVAQHHGLAFAESDEDVQKLIAEGALVAIKGDANYTLLPNMMYPYGQPEMRLFITRLGEQYRAATGEKLVVTSLTRPVDRQPANGHSLSVHPTGSAVDLRVSKQARSRQWLEAVLLRLERQGILDVTREKYPPHYHVALFPESYRAHVAGIIGEEALALALNPVEPKAASPEKVADSVSAGFLSISAPASAVGPSSDGGKRAMAWLAICVVAFAVASIFAYRRRILLSAEESVTPTSDARSPLGWVQPVRE